jgi:hypothetical protein
MGLCLTWSLSANGERGAFLLVASKIVFARTRHPRVMVPFLLPHSDRIRHAISTDDLSKRIFSGTWRPVLLPLTKNRQ